MTATGDLLIAAAVAPEVEKIISEMALLKRERIGGRQVIRGRVGGAAIRLLITGPGPVNAAQALTAAIENEKPQMIIQTGCAGAFKAAGMEMGDIGIATMEIDAHLGIDLGDEFLAPLPFPVLCRNSAEIRNQYPIPERPVKGALKILLPIFQKEGIQVKSGPFVTVSAITGTDARADALYAQYAPLMESMEGAAGAHVAIHYDIPFLEIRAASNFVGKRDRSRWDLPTAFSRAARGVMVCAAQYEKLISPEP